MTATRVAVVLAWLGCAAAAQAALPMRGVNLAGAEFGEGNLPGQYGVDYTFPTVQEVDYFHAKGMTTIRVGFRWERLQHTLGGPLDATYLAGLDTVVNHAASLGMKVIINPHNYARYYGNLVGSPQVSNAQFADFWSRLAQHYQTVPQAVFGLVNEPNTMPTEQWLAAANAAIAGIRATGSTHLILVPGNAWTGAHAWSQNWYGTPNAQVMTGVVDPGNHFAFELHQYFDADFSGTSATCLSAAGTGANQLQGVTQWLRTNGYKGFLAELGGANNTPCHNAVVSALDHLEANADVWLGWTWWAAGPWWGEYMLTLEPTSNFTVDRPQMAWLEPYLAGTGTPGQSLIVYDDALQNDFGDWSYGGGENFANTTPVHGGTRSIALTGNNYNAVSMTHESGPLSTANYPLLHFWIHGGSSGGQALNLVLQNGCSTAVCAPVAQASLNAFIAGGAAGANSWREVTVPITQAPLSYTGDFDRIDIEGASSGTQPTVYFDDIELQPGASGNEVIFVNGFDGALPTVGGLVQEHDVTVASMVSDRFTWRDSANKPRVAVLAHNDGQTGPTAPGGYTNRGGALREFRYQMPDDTTRVAGVTSYGNAGQGGFGYVVSHSAWPSNGGGCNGDDSPLGYGFPGAFQRVFEGRHHAIFRFTQNYPRHCSAAAGGASSVVPVTIDWTFSTGRDNPLWSITYDMSALPANFLFDDSRAPYGELNIDGAGATNISGVGWGDRWQFTSTTSPVTLNSQWTWNTPNTVPYVKLWVTSTNATMGLVQSQTMTQQDAGARNQYYQDITAFWNKTSAQGNAGGTYVMPWQDSWPYQANAYSIGPSTPNSNARLTWGTSFGFLGQSSYDVHDGVVATAAGYPRKSYAVYVVLGAHSTAPVEAQRSEIETRQTLSLGATIGSVAASGPAGAGRSDTISYQPAGNDPVYGALTFIAAGNALDANVAVGAGTLRHPLIIVRGVTAYPTTVKLNGSTLTADADYFASLRASPNELWLTLNRDLSGTTNRVQVQP